MALITARMLDLSRVTDEMIGRAHKVFDAQGKTFYQVESSDFENNGVEYNVTWSKEKGFQCTCESGREGFHNCGVKKVCDHVLIALAAAKEEKEAIKALNAKNAQPAQPKREHLIIANGQEVSDAQYKRIMNSKGQPTDTRAARSSLNSNRGFSLMK